MEYLADMVTHLWVAVVLGGIAYGMLPAKDGGK